MERATADGRAHSIGLPNLESSRPEDILDAASIPPSTLQVECRPYHQQNNLKKRLAPYGTALESWFPLGHGAPGLRQDLVPISLGERYGKPPAQIILRGHIQEGTIVFPRSTSAENMKENIDIFDFALTDDDMTRIRAIASSKCCFTMTLEEQETTLSRRAPCQLAGAHDFSSYGPGGSAR